MMHGPEKSDSGIVAMKPANKTEQSVAEPVERRAGTKGNVDQQSTCRTQSRISVSQALERIRKVQNALPSHTRGGSRMRESRTYGSVRGALSNRNCRGEAADMVARPYAIHSDSECDRLEKQAVLAGLENHLRHVPVPKTARILDAGCGSGAMARCFASHFADASVIGVDIRDDYEWPTTAPRLVGD